LLNTTGQDNVAVGTDALVHNDSANFINAVGAFALTANIDGTANNALGGGALADNVHAGGNTALGDAALSFNDVTEAGLANNNTAVGASALFDNTDGSDNTAVGQSVLFNNTTGGGNTAVGQDAPLTNSTGSNNTAVGQSALSNNTTIGANIGANNTAVGVSALGGNTTGSNNIALGVIAGSALTTGNNNIDIGNVGVAAEAFTTRIGNLQTATFIAGISGQTASGGVAVFVNADGKLGTSTSSARFKDEIKPMENASEAILALKPVTFRYKRELDPKGIPQFGLVAEDVEKVDPDLVVRDKNGEIYTVRYDAVNAMLLNEFLKEHRKVQELDVTVAQQQKSFESKLAQQHNEIEALRSGLQKVSAQLEVSKAAPQTVLSNQ
jgi:hypothetical protein